MNSSWFTHEQFMVMNFRKAGCSAIPHSHKRSVCVIINRARESTIYSEVEVDWMNDCTNQTGNSHMLGYEGEGEGCEHETHGRLIPQTKGGSRIF